MKQTSVQQLIFGASVERRVTSSSQYHPSNGEMDGGMESEMKLPPSGPLRCQAAEERKSKRWNAKCSIQLWLDILT